eukprot:425981_1
MTTINLSQARSATQLVEFCISTKYSSIQNRLLSLIQKTSRACSKYFSTLVLLLHEENKCINVTLNNNHKSIKVFESKLPDSFLNNINHYCELFKKWQHELKTNSQNNKQPEIILFKLPTDHQIKSIFKLLLFSGCYNIKNIHIKNCLCEMTFYGTFEKWELFPPHYCNKNNDNIPMCSSNALLVILETINQNHWLENIFIFEQMFLTYLLDVVIWAEFQVVHTSEACLDSILCQAGALLYFCSHQVLNMLQRNTEQELKVKIQRVIDYETKIQDAVSYEHGCSYLDCHPEIANANYILRILKGWSGNLRQRGFSFLARSYQQFQKLQTQTIKKPVNYIYWIEKMKSGDYSVPKGFDEDTIPSYAYFVFAKWFAKNKQLRKAQTFYIASAIASNTYYQRFISLRRLIKICIYWEEYAIAKKILKYAYSLCHIAENEGLIMFPSFVTKEYHKQNKCISYRTRTLCCSYCKRTQGVKLKACTGCMIAVYCNKSHQKRHWKMIHKTECNRVWKSNYKSLKSVVQSSLSAEY